MLEGGVIITHCQRHDNRPKDVLHKVSQVLGMVASLILVRPEHQRYHFQVKNMRSEPAAVEEDSGGVSSNTVLLTQSPVNRAVHLEREEA